MTDDEGNGVFSAVGHTDIELRNAYLCASLKSPPVKSDYRGAIPIGNNLNISPAHPSSTGTQCLHYGFLGGKAGSQTGDTVRALQLCLGINALKERVMPPGYGTVDSPNLDNVNADGSS
jgi:hypothetical protein